MSTFTISLSPEAERRIEELARERGCPKDEVVRDAILQYLADQEDVELARRRLAEPGRRKTLQELESAYPPRRGALRAPCRRRRSAESWGRLRRALKRRAG